LNSSNDRRLSEKDDIKNDPSEQAGGSASVGVEYGKGSICIHYVWISSVEPCPPHPQQPCTCQHQKDVVWRKPFPVLV